MSVGAYIDCDGCSFTPNATSAEGDFRRRLRTEQKAKGWTRVREGGRMLDLCATCSGKRAPSPPHGERDTDTD